MRKFILLITILAAFWGLSACSNNSDSSHTETSTDKSGHAKSAGPGIVEALKKKALDNYPSTTIGAAFEGYKYFAKKEWKETDTQHGKIYIDFIGWLDSKTINPLKKSDVADRGIDVKFVINPDGTFFVGMISKVEVKTDGKVYATPVEESRQMLELIYANKELVF